MIKSFCDNCKAVIDRENQFEHKSVHVGDHIVMVSVDESRFEKECGCVSEECLCLHCVIDAVNKLDNRPKVKSSYAN